MKIFKKLRAIIRLHRAVNKANEMFKKTGKRQYVVMQPDKTLVVMDRSGLKLLKKRKVLKWNNNVMSMEKASVYYTPYANGTCAMPSSKRESLKKQYYKLASK